MTTQENKIPIISIQPDETWLSLNLRDLWEYRELLFFLTWRDVMVRYKQSILGIGWAILQPLLTMVVFTLVFGNFAKIPSDGLPYPVFSYTALLPWTLFAQAISRSGASLVGSAHLITKVYFPRLIIPLSATLAPLVDFGFAFVILLGMMVWFGITPTAGILVLPLFILLAMATALAVGLWLSALNVRYRDVAYLIPFIVQLWMYASPVVYPVSIVPEQWRWLFGLNPMTGVIEGFRWALLGKANPDFGVIVISAGIVLALLIAGLVYFNRTESTFADVV